MALPKSSRRRAMSDVVDAETWAVVPSWVRNSFSGEIEGAVARPPFPSGDEPVERELGGAAQERPAGVAQPGSVARERVVLPQVHRVPGRAHRPVGPLRVALAPVPDRGGLPPQVGVVVRHPAPRPVVDPRGLAAVSRELGDHPQHRLVALGEVRHLRRPVVHLAVDVHRPVGAPRRAHVLVPDPLQVRGLAAGAGARDEQVAPVLEDERHEGGVLGRGGRRAAARRWAGRRRAGRGRGARGRRGAGGRRRARRAGLRRAEPPRRRAALAQPRPRPCHRGRVTCRSR